MTRAQFFGLGLLALAAAAGGYLLRTQLGKAQEAAPALAAAPASHLPGGLHLVDLDGQAHSLQDWQANTCC